MIVLMVMNCRIARSQCWSERITLPQTVLNAVAFCDSNNGIAVGTKTLRTTNGGTTWITYEFADPLIIELTDVFMFDSTRGFACNISGDLYRTTNGGANWIFRKTHLGTLAKYTFWDSLRGLCLAGGTIYRTTSGGAQWDARIGTSFADICCIDSIHAMAVGGTNLVYRTTDGGDLWFPPVNFVTDTMTLVSFADNQLGIIVTKYKSTRTILRTTNGGTDWASRTVSNGTYSNITSLDQDRWIGMFNNEVLVSSNGAATFSSQALPSELYENRDIRYLPNGNVVILQYFPASFQSRIVLLSKKNCVPVTTPIFPDHDARNVPLASSVAVPQSLILQWAKSHTMVSATSVVQYSLDSLFSEGTIREVSVNQSSGSDTLSVAIAPLLIRSTYYWRVALLNLDGTIAELSPPSRFTTAGGSLYGMVFRDVNLNGTVEADETGVRGCTIFLSGNHQNSTATDSLGMFSFRGLDSGEYKISFQIVPPWQSSALHDTLSVLLPDNGTITDLNFGEYFPWNSVTGSVFYDMNENGIQDNTEEGLPAWTVRIITPTRYILAQTDSLGVYSFPAIETEPCSVYVNPLPKWEKIIPRLFDSWFINFQGTARLVTGLNFAVHPIPPRVKISLFCHDEGSESRKDVQFGVRPGASGGIWKVDHTSTLVDFSEKEEELPPLSDDAFKFFDVRFGKPPGSRFSFGNGSWVDMRPYYSASQVDTFYLLFRTGMISGGGYPMTFTWSKELIAAAYTGSVYFKDSLGATFDMKALDSLVIADSTIGKLLLIAEFPVLPTDGISDASPILPGAYRLDQNYPNPFNPVTTIHYDLPEASAVRITIYDLMGREMESFSSGNTPPGSYVFNWDATGFPSGMYFYRLHALNKAGKVNSIIKKMVLIK